MLRTAHPAILPSTISRIRPIALAAVTHAEIMTWRWFT
jgi:hypothetical protein